jgi:hypothetical protein
LHVIRGDQGVHEELPGNLPNPFPMTNFNFSELLDKYFLFREIRSCFNCELFTVNSKPYLQNSLLSNDTNKENPKKLQKLRCRDETHHHKFHFKTMSSLPLHYDLMFLINSFNFRSTWMCSTTFNFYHMNFIGLRIRKDFFMPKGFPSQRSLCNIVSALLHSTLTITNIPRTFSWFTVLACYILENIWLSVH